MGPKAMHCIWALARCPRVHVPPTCSPWGFSGFPCALSFHSRIYLSSHRLAQPVASKNLLSFGKLGNLAKLHEWGT